MSDFPAFDALDAALERIERVPVVAAERCAADLTAMMPKGHAVAEADGGAINLIAGGRRLHQMYLGPTYEQTWHEELAKALDEAKR